MSKVTVTKVPDLTEGEIGSIHDWVARWFDTFPSMAKIRRSAMEDARSLCKWVAGDLHDHGVAYANYEPGNMTSYKMILTDVDRTVPAERRVGFDWEIDRPSMQMGGRMCVAFPEAVRSAAIIVGWPSPDYLEEKLRCMPGDALVLTIFFAWLDVYMSKVGGAGVRAFKVKVKNQLGIHTELRVFSGPDQDHLANCGNLIMLADDVEDFLSLLQCGANWLEERFDEASDRPNLVIERAS